MQLEHAKRRYGWLGERRHDWFDSFAWEDELWRVAFRTASRGREGPERALLSEDRGPRARHSGGRARHVQTPTSPAPGIDTEELRRAVAASETLQRLARERGEGFVRDLVRVHVNVTLPADLSFRSSGLAGFLPFVPDTVMLDHRKLFFYDVTEAEGHRARGINVHNEPGYAYKETTLLQSLLYTLAPPDTMIVVPDSIWANPLTLP